MDYLRVLTNDEPLMTPWLFDELTTIDIAMFKRSNQNPNVETEFFFVSNSSNRPLMKADEILNDTGQVQDTKTTLDKKKKMIYVGYPCVYKTMG